MLSKLFSGKKRTPTAAEIGEQISRAETELAELRAKFGPLALASAQGVDGADKEIATLERSIEEVQVQKRQLEAAYAAALEQEERAAQRSRAKDYADKMRQVKEHLDARDAAARALANAIADAVRHYRELVAQSQAAAAASPTTKWPPGAACGMSAIKRQLEVELFRQSQHLHANGGMVFPGGKPHDVSMLHRPEAAPALVEVLSQASAYAMAELKAEGQRIAGELAAVTG